MGHTLKNTKSGIELKRTYKRFELLPIEDVTETITRVTRLSKKTEKQIQEEKLKKKLKKLGITQVHINQPRILRKRKK